MFPFLSSISSKNCLSSDFFLFFFSDARAGQFDDEIKEKFVVLVYLIERIFVLALTR